MQIALGWRRVAVVLATLAVALFGLSTVSAQDSDTHRFFGFAGDVTIDDQPLAQGAAIVAMVDDIEIGQTKVNQAGAWILDVSSKDFTNEPCNVTFVFDGHHIDPGWKTCELRVRLAVTTPGGAQAEQSEDSMAEDAGADEEEAAAEASNGGELTTEDNDEEPAASEQTQIVRPAPPRTGTGGVLASEQSTNWPQAAAITALLMFGLTTAALIISRRTDSTS